MKQLDSYKYRTSVPFLRWLYPDDKHNNLDNVFNTRNVLPEIILALVLFASFNSWGETTQSISSMIIYLLWTTIVFIFFTLAIVNSKTLLLPNALIQPLALVVVIFQIIVAIQANNAGVLTDAVIGGLILGGIPYVLFQISAGRWIGGGDVKLGFAAGLLLGWKLGLLCLAIVVSLLLISFLVEYISSKVSKTHLPFRIPTGVMWLSSILISVAVGQQIIN